MLLCIINPEMEPRLDFPFHGGFKASILLKITQETDVTIIVDIVYLSLLLVMLSFVFQTKHKLFLQTWDFIQNIKDIMLLATYIYPILENVSESKLY